MSGLCAFVEYQGSLLLMSQEIGQISALSADVAAIRENNRAVMAARLLDMKEVAERLRVSRSTTFDLVGSGRLRSVKLGKRRLVPEIALVEFIENL
jgi:excisionase family DNA binding protein